MQKGEADQRKRGSIDLDRADLELPGWVEQLNGTKRPWKDRDVETRKHQACQ